MLLEVLGKVQKNQPMLPMAVNSHVSSPELGFPGQPSEQLHLNLPSQQ